MPYNPRTHYVHTNTNGFFALLFTIVSNDPQTRAEPKFSTSIKAYMSGGTGSGCIVA